LTFAYVEFVIGAHSW